MAPGRSPACRSWSRSSLHEGDAPLDPKGLIAAAQDVDFIIADRATPVPAEVFASLPRLKVVMRSAIDIRNIDVAAASKAGVLVTHAEAGFVKSVVELTLGFLVDLSRGVTRAATAYHEGRKPEIKVGRQLAGSTVGIIGYGRISRELAPVLAAMGMTVLVSDPYAQVDDRRFQKLPLEELLGRADYVICLAIANEETENLMNAAAFARMKPDAFFINMSRGNLVDEAALLQGPDGEPHRRRGHGCRPRARPDAVAGTGAPGQRYRDAPYRGSDAARQRKPSLRHGPPGRGAGEGRGPAGCGEPRGLDADVSDHAALQRDLFAAHVGNEDVGDYQRHRSRAGTRSMTASTSCSARSPASPSASATSATTNG